MKKELKIKFRTPDQYEAFIRWLNGYGFIAFQESDSVHDDIPYNDLPEEILYVSGNTDETTLQIK